MNELQMSPEESVLGLLGGLQHVDTLGLCVSKQETIWTVFLRPVGSIYAVSVTMYLDPMCDNNCWSFLPTNVTTVPFADPEMNHSLALTDKVIDEMRERCNKVRIKQGDERTMQKLGIARQHAQICADEVNADNVGGLIRVGSKRQKHIR